MEKKRGRPMKYAHFLMTLEDSKIYSAATIVRNGERLGFFPKGLKGDALKEAKTRVRMALGRLSSNRHFPYEGDGFLRIKGQPPVRGWTGKRWKAAAGEQVA